MPGTASILNQSKMWGVNNIIIQKIEMFNFGPYYGNHQILFGNDGSGIHLIRGGNGQGKTSIQRAILWGLYGIVYDRKGEKIRPTSLLNHTAQKADLYNFAVRIDLLHDGVSWRLIRDTKAKRHQDKKYEEGMTFEVYKDGRIVPDPDHEVQRLLPSSVSRFYFFDGEMLRDYEELLEGENSAMVLLKDSIECVLGVPYFKTTRSDLEAVKKKFERERARIMRQLGGKDLEELADFQQMVEGDLNDVDNSIKKLEEERNKLDSRISDDKHRLADMEEVKELANERIAKENDIEVREAKKETKITERSALVEKLYKNVLANTATTLIERFEIKSKQALDRYNDKQKAIGNAKRLEKGIKERKCSCCGAVLNPDKLPELERELEEAKIEIEQLTQIPEPNLSFENSKTVLEKMVGNVVSSEDLTKIDNEIDKIDYELARLGSELENIQSKLKGVDAEEPRKLEMNIRAGEKESGRLEGRIAEKRDKKLELLEAKSDLDRKIDSIPQDQFKKLKERIALAENIRNVFEQAISKFRDEQKEQVEATATEIFKELRSKQEFDRLKINDQYGLSIVTR
jgi:DNA sulfur modification protein DndD